MHSKRGVGGRQCTASPPDEIDGEDREIEGLSGAFWALKKPKFWQIP